MHRALRAGQPHNHLARAPGVNYGSQPEITPFGVDNRNPPSRQDTEAQLTQAPVEDSDEIIILARQETVTERVQHGIGLAGHESGVHSNVAPFHAEDLGSAVRREEMTRHDRNVTRPSQDDSHKEEHDHSSAIHRVEIPQPSRIQGSAAASEKDYHGSDPHPRELSRARSSVLVVTCMMAMVVNVRPLVFIFSLRVSVIDCLVGVKYKFSINRHPGNREGA